MRGAANDVGRTFLLVALVLVVLLGAGGCAQLGTLGRTDLVEQRLKVPEKCKLMGQQDTSDTCTVVRQRLIGATQTAGDKQALACYDALHAKDLKKAEKALQQGLAKEPSNANLLACGRDVEGFAGK